MQERALKSAASAINTELSKIIMARLTSARPAEV
jgi:hypothetical protein